MTNDPKTDPRWTYHQNGYLWEEASISGSTIGLAKRCDHCDDRTPRLMIELQERVWYEAPGVTVCRDCLAAMLAALDRAPELLATPDTEESAP